jgi:hypothetical protein
VNYVDRMVQWLKNDNNQVPLSPNMLVLEPSIARMCEEFGVLRRNKDVQIAVDLYLESLQTSKPKVLRDDGCRQDDWYEADLRAGITRPIWNRLSTYLMEKRGRFTKEIAHVDSESNAVVNSLHNPKINEPFSHRGMVVGYVQSGKTTNMSATIAKASDSGYRCIVVLAGVLDTLRQQTQFRFQQELFGYRQNVFSGHHANASCVPDDDTCHIIPVTDCDPNDPSNGEITNERLRALFHDYNHPDRWSVTRVFVIKKTTTRIDLLSDFFKSLNRVHKDEKFDVPTLVIDDECDQATINTKFRKGDVTAVNRSIRQLLAGMRRSSYVGYTATPFANLFIDPHTDDKDLGKDVYPKDFIACLTPPPQYTGTKELFGVTSLRDPEEDISPLDIFCSIPEQEIRLLGQRDARGSVRISATENSSLWNAVHDYILSAALQTHRGRESEDMTMLIHPSSFTDLQNRIYAPLQDLVVSLQAARTGEDLHDRLKARFESEFVPRSQSMKNLPFAKIPDSPVRYSDIREIVDRVIGSIELVLLHGRSQHVLRYGDKHNPKRYIVVGGNKLSRGLTLEGLSVSYFLRKSATYDTLLQMGRWFGYRASYVDLTRLYMSDQMRDFFSALAFVELDMREQFERNYLDAKTPSEVPTHIAKITGLNIVAGNRMGSATTIAENYGGRFIEQNRVEIDQLDRLVTRNHSIIGLLESLPPPLTVASHKVAGKARPGAHFWGRILDGRRLADLLEPIDLSNIKKDLVLSALRGSGSSSDFARLKWVVSVAGKEGAEPCGKFNVGGVNYPIVSVNRRLRPQRSTATIQRLVSHTDLDSFVKPEIRKLGEDPDRVGIVSLFFVNSSPDVLWGDRQMNPVRPSTWSTEKIPYIATLSLVVPVGVKGLNYIGLDLASNDSDEGGLESDD